MIHHRFFQGLILVSALVAAGPSVAGAQNLLANPGFDGGLSGWQVQNDSMGTGSWSSVDADGAAGSGSAVVTNLDSRADVNISRVYKCLPVTAGTEYHFAADVRIPGGQKAGSVNLQLLWFSQPGCFASGSPAFPHQPMAQTSALNTWVALGGDLVAPAGAVNVLVTFWVDKLDAGGSLKAHFDNAFFAQALPPGPCVPSDAVLCIDDVPGDRRFRIEVAYSTTQGGGRSGPGHAVPLASVGFTRGGAFWFFSPANPELLIKVLNACTLAAPSYWVFYTATTNVGFSVTVTDTVTGRVFSRTNPDLRAAPPIQDTSALPCN